MVSVVPGMSAPIIAPRMLPIPPMTAAMKAFQPTMIPMYGSITG